MGMNTGNNTESQYHVLAVDDSVVDRKLIERLLKTSSFHVTTVDSGSKALEFLGFHEDKQSNSNSSPVSPNDHQEVQVNLVITDYCMPGMTGYDLLKKIKESSSLKNIPVVIMSSENVPSRITSCLEEGAEEFFLKPVRSSDLNKLRQLMKARFKDQKQEKQEQGVNLQLSTDSQLQKLQEEQLPPLQQLQQGQLPQLQQLQEEQLPQLPQVQQEQLQSPASNNNKRKSMEEGLTQDRTRPRYELDGLTTMV